MAHCTSLGLNVPMASGNRAGYSGQHVSPRHHDRQISRFFYFYHGTSTWSLVVTQAKTSTLTPTASGPRMQTWSLVASQGRNLPWPPHISLFLTAIMSLALPFSTMYKQLGFTFSSISPPCTLVFPISRAHIQITVIPEVGVWMSFFLGKYGQGTWISFFQLPQAWLAWARCLDVFHLEVIPMPNFDQ